MFNPHLNLLQNKSSRNYSLLCRLNPKRYFSRIAMEEILREAKSAAERAKEMGASGWYVCV